VTEPLTREAFDQARAVATLASRRGSRVLAVASVAPGVLQLIFLRWADAHLERGLKLSIALPAFVTYITVVVVLLWRMERKKGSFVPICPQCGIKLIGLSERVAAATGKCDSCGGVVVDERHADRP